MEDIRAYVLSVTAAAILCAIVNVLIGKKGAVSAIIRLLTGIVMAAVVIQPLGSFLLSDLNSYFLDLDAQVSAAVALGTEISREDLERRIKEQTEAYILDKAAEYDLTLTVEVKLDEGDPPVPAGVILEGSTSPAVKNALQTLIADELGIPKEDQTWI